MPLQLGAWNMNLNGMQVPFSIDGIDASGRVLGKLMLPAYQPNIKGFWDETSQELSFAPFFMGGPNADVMPFLFKGYLFGTPQVPQPGQDVLWTLAGTYQSLDLDQTYPEFGKANGRRNIFGWVAQITVIT